MHENLRLNKVIHYMPLRVGGGGYTDAHMPQPMTPRAQVVTRTQICGSLDPEPQLFTQVLLVECAHAGQRHVVFQSLEGLFYTELQYNIYITVISDVKLQPVSRSLRAWKQTEAWVWLIFTKLSGK